MNNLFQQLNQARQLPSNVRQMAQMFKAMKNPQLQIQQMMNQNPQLKALIDSANGNPEKAFRDLAQQMGVNPEEIIDLLK